MPIFRATSRYAAVAGADAAIAAMLMPRYTRFYAILRCRCARELRADAAAKSAQSVEI